MNCMAGMMSRVLCSLTGTALECLQNIRLIIYYPMCSNVTGRRSPAGEFRMCLAETNPLDRRTYSAKFTSLDSNLV